MNPERENLYRGLSHAAWGYFFLNFNFNLNNVSFLPSFVGYLLLLFAINKLSGERRDLALLKPLAILLAGWEALDWLASWISQDVDGHILFLNLVAAAVFLYFHFQFLTDMAALAEQYQPEGDDLAGRLCRRRTAYIVLLTAINVFQRLPLNLSGRLYRLQAVLAGGGLAATVIMALSIMAALFRLRRCFRETENGIG